MTLMKAPDAARKKGKVPAAIPVGRRKQRTDWGAYLYVLPATVLLLVFSIWPLFFGFWISLWKWGIGPQKFVGFANYVAIFTRDLLQDDGTGALVPGPIGQALLNTAYYVAGSVAVSIVLAFVFAYLLFRIKSFRNTLQSLFFLPYATTIVASALVFIWIFDPQLGIANAILKALGLPAQTWLLDATPAAARFLSFVTGTPAAELANPYMGPSVAMCVVILFNIWNTLGFSIMIYLSGLASLPAELLDASALDGAGERQTVRHIVLPLMKPTTLFLLMYSTVHSFKSFTPIFSLTQGGFSGGNGTQEAGGPLGTTNVLTTEIFNNFYQRQDQVGYASAVSFLLLALLITLTLVQFRLLGRRSDLD